MFGMSGHWELLIVAGIILLLFGKRLPGVMRSLGTSIVEFKKGIKGVEAQRHRGTEAQREAFYNFVPL